MLPKPRQVGYKNRVRSAHGLSLRKQQLLISSDISTAFMPITKCASLSQYVRLLVRIFKGRGGGSRWAWPIGAVIVRREQVGVADLSGLCRAALEGTADSFKAMQGGSWRHGGSLRTTQGQCESMADASGLCTEGAGGRGGSLRAMQGGSGGSCRSFCSAVDADVGVSKRAGLMPRLWFLRKGYPHW